MDIQVFGPGTARSAALTKQCQLVAAEKGGGISVSKIANRDRISELGIRELPVVAIDGIVKSSGRIPSRGEISNWIDEAAARRHPTRH
ncbi:thioredoxin family protein [Oxalobacter sp. OttesenSCG-928-P03]|nr:thioredoxin family protein [Oxalobacter sp. OttesenSCG-928-P03]